MNPEIWMIIEDERIGELVTDVAESEGLVLRSFENIAGMFNQPDPASGLILVIDASGELKNYMTIIKRFAKRKTDLDTIVFGEEKNNAALERERMSGVDLYVKVPPAKEDFFVRASRLISFRRLKSSVNIVGRSNKLNEMLETVLQVAPTEVPVLIVGESGSGKELTAKAIHIKSRRSSKSFEAVNCGSLAEGVLESELFGHEKGSFTGAMARRRGLFERADGGTLFLDEVGETPLSMQVRLLRVIETGDFFRVGGNEKIHTDVRIIAATNKELEGAVSRGEFREDLYYRLKVVKIRIPPLRSRPEDIPLLVQQFLRQSSKRHGKNVKGVEKKGLELLESYPWPGNVRELANVVDNLSVLVRGSIIEAGDIEERLQERMTSQPSKDLPVHLQRSRDEMERELILNSLLSLHNDVSEILSLLKGERLHANGRPGKWMELKDMSEEEPRDMESIERDAIREALIMNDGNRRKTARQLSLSERTLYRRLKKYGLN